MKKLLIFFSASLTIFGQSCNSNSNCPSPINNSLGTYIPCNQYACNVQLDVGDILYSPISVEIKNSVSCDYVDIKLLGAATGTLKAKFQGTIPGMGNLFLISDGQNYNAGGRTYRTYNSGTLYVREAELSLGVNSFSTNTDNDLGGLAYLACK